MKPFDSKLQLPRPACIELSKIALSEESITSKETCSLSWLKEFTRIAVSGSSQTNSYQKDLIPMTHYLSRQTATKGVLTLLSPSWLVQECVWERVLARSTSRSSAPTCLTYSTSLLSIIQSLLVQTAIRLLVYSKLKIIQLM